MDWTQLAQGVTVALFALVLIVVMAYVLAWAIASGWARGKQTVPVRERIDRSDLRRWGR